MRIIDRLRRRGGGVGSLTAEHVEAVVEALRPVLGDNEARALVLVESSNEDALTARLAQDFPGTQLDVLTGDVDHDSVVASLRTRPPVDAIVDARPGDGLSTLRQFLWSVRPRGTYVIAGVTEQWSATFAAASERESDRNEADNRRREELGKSARSVSVEHGVASVRKHFTHQVTLRHDDVEAVLSERYDDWGEVMARREAYSYESRAEVTMHGEPPNTKPQTIDVPALALRRYRDVTCHRLELMSRDEYLLPDSFRHWQDRRLFHRRVWQTPSATYSRMRDQITPDQVRHEPGELFALDSAFPDHFGHLTTETLSRVWGWRIAKAKNPDIRPVMTHIPGRERLPTFKADILRALGIPLEDICWVTRGESVQVESLVAAMPQLVNPRYIDRDITETWDELYDGFGPDPHPENRPERLFVSRAPGTQRFCSNSAEVEAFVTDLGYTVVYPERLSVAEQAHTFRRAKVIAGFAGSALFNMMHNRDAPVVILASETYTAANEYLFASASGNPLHYFWGPASVEAPEAGFSRDAYRSDFTFPLEVHRNALRAAMG